MLNKLSLRLKDHTCHPHKHHFQSGRAYVSSAFPRERRHRRRRRSRISVCARARPLHVCEWRLTRCLSHVSRCRGRSLFFVCVCGNLLLRNIYEPVPFLKKESVVFNEHVLEIVSASIIYKARLHLWTGLVCKCEYLIITEKIHLTQLLYWHNMTLLEQTDILGRRPVCACVCLSVSVSYEGMSMEGFLPIVGGEGCWRWQYLILADRFAQMASATAAPNATNRVTRVRAISHVTPN